MNLRKLREQFKEKGHTIARKLFTPSEAEVYRDHYMALRENGHYANDLVKEWADDEQDPLKRYPRMINMHHLDEVSRAWLLDESIQQCLVAMLDQAPYAIQTMLYFKPPGGRGQALHQDQQYITTDPLIGVWVALDKSDQSVGQMIVIPKSHQYGLLEVEPADTSISFTNVQSVIPPDAEQVGLDMEPGDVLFFDGKMIHGSYRNSTTDRWRRSFICHYIGENSQSFVAPQGKHVSHLKV